MRQPIIDEFTHLKISRQRKYQLRQQRDGKCLLCGKPIVLSGLCLKHGIEHREQKRKRLKCKRRYSNTLSYRLQRGEVGA